MSEHTLETALTDYLAVRRSLGFKLTREDCASASSSPSASRPAPIESPSEVALAWVTTPAKASPSWLNMRLSMVRGFARWLQASDPSTEVPPRWWLPPIRRTNPYLYSEADIVALMAAAQRARWPLSAATYETLIGLLAVTGLRIGEAIRLDRADVSLADGLLTIRESSLASPDTSRSIRARSRSCARICAAAPRC